MLPHIFTQVRSVHRRDIGETLCPIPSHFRRTLSVRALTALPAFLAAHKLRVCNATIKA